MGNIRQTYIKRVAIELVKKHPDAFTESFDANKKQVNALTDIGSKSMRNRVAGYVTRYRKRFVPQVTPTAPAEAPVPEAEAAELPEGEPEVAPP